MSAVPDGMGKKKKGNAAPPTIEEIDVDRYRLLTNVATRDTERLRTLVGKQHGDLEDALVERREQVVERDDMYQYLDAQMLQTARDRQANENALRQFQSDAERERSSLLQRLTEQADASARMIEKLQAELAQRTRDLDELRDFRGVRPLMESEIARLKSQLANEREDRKMEEHKLHIDLWRQRDHLNNELTQRVAHAKTNFLSIASEMLDSTVHRTMSDNQHMSDEMALMTSRMESVMRENQALLADRAALRRELHLMRDAEASEIRRSVARRRLAEMATQQHESLDQELQLAQAELSLAEERAKVQDTTIGKLVSQLNAAQRRVTGLTQRTAQQQRLIETRLQLGTEPTTPPIPDWGLILPNARERAPGGAGARGQGPGAQAHAAAPTASPHLTASTAAAAAAATAAAASQQPQPQPQPPPRPHEPAASARRARPPKGAVAFPSPPSTAPTAAPAAASTATATAQPSAAAAGCISAHLGGASRPISAGAEAEADGGAIADGDGGGDGEGEGGGTTPLPSDAPSPAVQPQPQPPRAKSASTHGTPRTSTGRSARGALPASSDRDLLSLALMDSQRQRGFSARSISARPSSSPRHTFIPAAPPSAAATSLAPPLTSPLASPLLTTRTIHPATPTIMPTSAAQLKTSHVPGPLDGSAPALAPPRHSVQGTGCSAAHGGSQPARVHGTAVQGHGLTPLPGPLYPAPRPAAVNKPAVNQMSNETSDDIDNSVPPATDAGASAAEAVAGAAGDEGEDAGVQGAGGDGGGGH